MICSLCKKLTLMLTVYNQESRIGYMLVTKGCSDKNFAVLDPDINF